MFETNQLIIRPYKTSDAEAVQKTISNYQIYRTTYGLPYPCDVKYVKKWIKNVLSSATANKSYEYAIINKATGAYMGNVGLINIDSTSKNVTSLILQTHFIVTMALQPRLVLL